MRGANRGRTLRARRLGHNATRAELLLWNRLRSRQLGGFKFIRQEPIGRYVVDFICRDRRVIVEVDRGQHVMNEHDRTRDQWLRQQNYRVLRFWNNDVLQNTEGVLETILSELLSVNAPHPVASGDRPLPAGGQR